MLVLYASDGVIFQREGEALIPNSKDHLQSTDYVTDIQEDAFFIIQHEGDNYVVDAIDFAKIKAAVEASPDIAPGEEGQITIEQMIEILQVESFINPINNLEANIRLGHVDAGFDTITRILVEEEKEEEHRVQQEEPLIPGENPVVMESAPSIEVIKEGDGTIEEGGDTALYSITLINNSTQEDLTITALDDDQFGDLLPEALAAYILLYGETDKIVLEPGGEFSFEFERELDLNANETHTNVVTVIGEDDEANEVSDDDDHEVTAEDVLPDVTVVKTGDGAIEEGGDTALYSITLINNSTQEDLTITALDDDQFGDLLPEALAAYILLYGETDKIVLEPGGEFSFEFERELDLNANETHTNVVTVIGEDDEGNEVSDDDDHEVTAEDVLPDVTVVKTGDGTVEVGGDTATYMITLINNSTQEDLTITALDDDQFGDLLPEALAAYVLLYGPSPAIVLGPEEEFSFEFERELDLDVNETHTNVVTVIGEDDEDNEVSDDDDHTVEAEAGEDCDCACMADPHPFPPYLLAIALVGTEGNSGGSGDLLIDFLGQNLIYGLSGDDEIYGLDGDDEIYGGNGDDEIHGGDGDDVISGYNGEDKLYGEAGDDEIHGCNGKDEIYGGSGDDELYGENGKDEIHGGSGNDTIYGGHGVDDIDGGAGDDMIYGGVGNNTLSGNSKDNLTGGDGADTFFFDGNLGQFDNITDFDAAEGDKINVAQIIAQTLGGDPLDTNNINDYVSVVDGTGGDNGDVVISINDNGNYKKAFVLEDTDLATISSGLGVPVTDAQSMYDNGAGALIVE